MASAVFDGKSESLHAQQPEISSTYDRENTKATSKRRFNLDEDRHRANNNRKRQQRQQQQQQQQQQRKNKAARAQKNNRGEQTNYYGLNSSNDSNRTKSGALVKGLLLLGLLFSYRL